MIYFGIEFFSNSKYSGHNDWFTYITLYTIPKSVWI